MKIAALYDIHGNLPALDAVLEELREVQPDLVVVGGDIVSGPMPGPTLDHLFRHGGNLRFIYGNGERDVITVFDGKPLSSPLSKQGDEKTSWFAERLTRSQRDFLDGLPEQITLHVENLGDILFCHATPRNCEEIFTPYTPPELLATIFAGVEQPIVVCGHTHVQFEQQVGTVKVINAGSIGMPYADQPGAYWLLLSPQGYEFRRTAYDLEVASQAILASGMPDAQSFVEENVKNIPTGKEALEYFERMAHNLRES